MSGCRFFGPRRSLSLSLSLIHARARDSRLYKRMRKAQSHPQGHAGAQDLLCTTSRVRESASFRARLALALLHMCRHSFFLSPVTIWRVGFFYFGGFGKL